MTGKNNYLFNMHDILYLYLKNEWKLNNSNKYQIYFEEWVSNLTDIQIYYYTKLWLEKSYK